MALSKEQLKLIDKTGVIPNELLQEYLSDKLLLKPLESIISDEDAYKAAKARLSAFAGDKKVDNSKKKGK